MRVGAPRRGWGASAAVAAAVEAGADLIGLGVSKRCKLLLGLPSTS